MLKYKDEQRRFSLSFEKGEPPTIRVAIWEPCVDRLSEIFGMHKGIPGYMEQWKFKRSELNLRKGFGFNGAMSTIGVEDGYLVLRAPLSKNQTSTAVSIGLLLGILRFYPRFAKDHFKEETPADPKRLQLMELEGSVSVDGGLHAATLGGTSSPALASWVEGVFVERHRLEEVEEAMWMAWNAMSTFKIKKEKRSPNPYPHFGMRLDKNGAFFLSTCGNACDLSTMDWWQRRVGDGHDLGCHNLDTPIQQLSLLAGLAAMHDLVSKDIDPRPPK